VASHSYRRHQLVVILADQQTYAPFGPAGAFMARLTDAETDQRDAGTKLDELPRAADNCLQLRDLLLWAAGRLTPGPTVRALLDSYADEILGG
jgi:hypothetical protein